MFVKSSAPYGGNSTVIDDPAFMDRAKPHPGLALRMKMSGTPGIELPSLTNPQMFHFNGSPVNRAATADLGLQKRFRVGPVKPVATGKSAAPKSLLDLIKQRLGAPAAATTAAAKRAQTAARRPMREGDLPIHLQPSIVVDHAPLGRGNTSARNAHGMRGLGLGDNGDDALSVDTTGIDPSAFDSSSYFTPGFDTYIPPSVITPDVPAAPVLQLPTGPVPGAMPGAPTAFTPTTTGQVSMSSAAAAPPSAATALSIATKAVALGTQALTSNEQQLYSNLTPAQQQQYAAQAKQQSSSFSGWLAAPSVLGVSNEVLLLGVGGVVLLVVVISAAGKRR
jgi:hypothetical protein